MNPKCYRNQTSLRSRETNTSINALKIEVPYKIFPLNEVTVSSSFLSLEVPQRESFNLNLLFFNLSNGQKKV